ncbi:hypothetical protein D9M71_455390 [compost metagenome]
MRDQQDELFTTEAGDEIPAAQVFAQHVGNNFQDLVAGQVTIAVIDALEVIEIEDRHQQVTTAFLPFQHFLIHPL